VHGRLHALQLSNCASLGLLRGARESSPSLVWALSRSDVLPTHHVRGCQAVAYWSVLFIRATGVGSSHTVIASSLHRLTPHIRRPRVPRGRSLRWPSHPACDGAHQQCCREHSMRHTRCQTGTPSVPHRRSTALACPCRQACVHSPQTSQLLGRGGSHVLPCH